MMRTAVEGVPLALYLAVSGALFLIGLLGVMTRRNPLLLLLAIELLLNSANLSLVAFSRYWNVTDGQTFALIVMVVAAAEVVIGLGLVVAVFRQRIALDVDQMTSMKG
ncbi:MAG TPA: NADH-quinone oxidoreductase subunit NuoK [Miltoncostaeaceae bacterium]|jgi:NADH-quinone oxidoreductase subunit K|nr:NADH-quinone oxidoreductase subunit NuoK [Miltoncostaeaceae bacterium]